MSRGIDVDNEMQNNETHYCPKILKINQFLNRGVLIIPPQPLWFPDTDNLNPLPKGRKETLRFIDAMKEGSIVGFARTNYGTSLLGTFHRLSREKIVDYILNPAAIPTEEACIVQMQNGVVFPFNLPDFSDLSLHPKALKVFLEWKLKNSTYDNFYVVINTLLQETAMEMPTRRETWNMEHGGSQVTIRSFGNYFKDVKVDADLVNRVCVRAVFKHTTVDSRDGRTLELSINPIRNEVLALKRKRIMDSMMHYLLIWNCRGVASWGFLTALEHFKLCHEPEYIVLLETRVTLAVMERIGQQLGLKVAAWSPPIGGAFGVAILTTVEKVSTISMVECSSTSWECTLEIKRNV